MLLWHLHREDVEYTLCTGCLVGLVSLSLFPEQFHRLLDSGHTAKEFFLHRDFYDEDGNARYPSPFQYEAPPAAIAEGLRMVALAVMLKVAEDVDVMRSLNPEDGKTYFRLASWVNALEKLSDRIEASLGLSDGKTAGGVIDPGGDAEE